MRIAATFAGGAVIATMMTAQPLAPSASAVPGDPMAGCETQVFAQYCDGPIREDGSWKRCLFANGQYGGGAYVPPVTNCFIIPSGDQIPPLPLGQPDHHIE
ncbi:CDGP domain-containing protein [Mycolicibacterium moriokaense]|uniref:CDGP domain-containing protein n=1 Tax=Mycolicibacterium moriokaense TaxID=39691 RepID=A0A318HHR0_9MYCO|nr:hypothetical protein [Mycolicibacterium moriokaense]PXX09238.1 hypothetical protein C8E89_106165 [Mycolicibacterium moriokaense]